MRCRECKRGMIAGVITPSSLSLMQRYYCVQAKTNMCGINFHIKYCKDCGTYLLNEQDTCPKCNSKNIQGISRVTGYLSLDERFAPEDSFGKGAEKADRISHNKKEKFISYKR